MRINFVLIISMHAIPKSVGSTDNRDQVMNALITVLGHNDDIRVHELT